MNRTGSRSPTTLPPVTLTPEEAAAVALALAGQPEGAYTAAGRGALEKVLAALEPDPRRHAGLLAAVARVAGHPSRRARTGERVPSPRHPAGRRHRSDPDPARPAPEAPVPPRLVVLPGGRA
ncbi:hypothetical protein [Blastococcus saxobsidens]|uniref:Uncharacterized protein n=1 Tax=Blastococcus saxobsidens (strain DD2) TaxID=1146883 RepID=H6RLI4_BLASD|nr:hypothetical protein [Blastococcus saxobsidens]CCG02510.1 protein of unknown function [Blastococcus saxobsidens DD2]